MESNRIELGTTRRDRPAPTADSHGDGVNSRVASSSTHLRDVPRAALLVQHRLEVEALQLMIEDRAVRVVQMSGHWSACSAHSGEAVGQLLGHDSSS